MYIFKMAKLRHKANVYLLNLEGLNFVERSLKFGRAKFS